MNCSGEHAAFEKSCPRWQLETEIVKAKITHNISFPEARRMVEARSVSASSITYSAMVRSAGSVSVATQTDSVSCTCHCGTSVVEAQAGTSSAAVQTETRSTLCTETSSAKKNENKIAQPTIKIPTKTVNVNKQQPATTINTKKNNMEAVPSRNASSAGNSPKGGARGVRDSKGATGKSWKDTGSDPDRVPKGSNDPVRIYNRYVSLESMDTIDDIAIPSNEGKTISSVPKT